MTVIMFSASPNKQKHLHCALAIDSECCVIAEEYLSPSLYEGVKGLPLLIATENQNRLGSMSEHPKVPKGPGCGKG